MKEIIHDAKRQIFDCMTDNTNVDIDTIYGT